MWSVAILALLAIEPGPRPAPAAVPAPTANTGKTPGKTPAKTPASESASIRLSITATTERIPLPGLRGPVELTVDALARRIVLRPTTGTNNLQALASHIGAHVGVLCPRVEVKGSAVELACRSRRFEAQVTPEGKLSYLDINEVRGLPWRQGPDAPPSYHYDPWRVGLGQSCPGRSEVVQGECALKRGESLQAAMHFRASLETTGRPLACLRLGDLAVSIGDPLTAAGWYRRAGMFGPFGRVAASRLCELDGSCLGTTEEVTRLYDANGLPEPLRAEMTMRAARAEAYAGRLPAAIHIIVKQARGHGMASVCREGGDPVCRRILLEAMRATKQTNSSGVAAAAPGKTPAATPAGAPMLDAGEREYLEELMETYLLTPSWEKGPLAVEMSQAAAPIASRLGAPGFGGNLLASLAPEVPDAQLSEHLLLAAETFLQGQNWARARIVTEYAESRLGDQGKGKGKGKAVHGRAGAGLQGPRWAAVLRQIAGRAEEEEVTPEVRAAIETEMTATLAELKNARSVLNQADGLLAGARDAKAAREGQSGAGAEPREKPSEKAGEKPGDKSGDKAKDKAGDEPSGGRPANTALKNAPRTVATVEPEGERKP